MQKSKYINKIIQGDCLEVMQDIPDNSVDMVLCDLPYGTTQNKWDSVIPLDQLWEQYYRIVKLNGAIVLTAQGIFTAKLIMSNEAHFKYQNRLDQIQIDQFFECQKTTLAKARRHLCFLPKTTHLQSPDGRRRSL